MPGELRGTTKENAKAFRMDDLETLRRDLAQLPPNRPKNVTKHDAVAALIAEPSAAQRRDYSVEELAELRSAKGLVMTPGMLRGATCGAREGSALLPRRSPL
jgi:hypothetical protein